MVSLYRDPDGNSVLTGSSHAYSENSGSTGNKFTMHDKKNRSLYLPNDSVIVLRARIKELEDQLETSGVSVKVSHMYSQYIIPTHVWYVRQKSELMLRALILC